MKVLNITVVPHEVTNIRRYKYFIFSSNAMIFFIYMVHIQILLCKYSLNTFLISNGFLFAGDYSCPVITGQSDKAQADQTWSRM